MKKLIIVGLVVMFTSGIAFAGGGQNTIRERGDKGKGTLQGQGTTSTGSSAQGAATQGRSQQRGK